MRLTAELLASAVFRCAAVPDPSGWAWVTADPGNIAPYTAEGLAADVRERLHAYAGAPDPDDAESTEDDDGWARRGVDDERLIASGWVGAELYGHDPSLVVALADADEDLRRRVIRWVRLWGFAEAELIDQPWFAAVRQAVESGGAVSDLDRERASQHFAPLLIAPEVGPDGRLDLGARHFHASGLIPVSPGDGSLAEAAEVLLAAAALDNLRFDRICGAVRRGFPELGGAHSE